MTTARDTTEEFPHITFRDVAGRREAYVSDTGLAVWEIALLARGYDGDAAEIARETFTDRDLIEEGLCYVAKHHAETDAEIARHTVNSMEELQGRFPKVPILVTGTSPNQEQVS